MCMSVRSIISNNHYYVGGTLNRFINYNFNPLPYQENQQKFPLNLEKHTVTE